MHFEEFRFGDGFENVGLIWWSKFSSEIFAKFIKTLISVKLEFYIFSQIKIFS
jgi:hypothetical protein